MNAKFILPLAAGLVAIGAPALAEAPAKAGPVVVVKADASLPFADKGGVQDWRAVSDREIWFLDTHRTWYRAVLFGPAFELPWVEHIGIDARPGGTLDRFGGIIVKGQRYNFVSFDKMSGPPPKKPGKAHKH